ncbi:MAG: signal peptidase II [Pseudomonadota bacterium]
MQFKYKVLLIITPLVFLFDQLTKWLVIKNIPLFGKIPIIAGYLDLVHYQNPGAAFGMFAQAAPGFRQPFFYIVTVVAIIIFAIYFLKLSKESRLLPITFSLIFGGIAGNIIDRIRVGAVTDFISVHIQYKVVNWTLWGKNISIPLDWPAFNVADSAITIAMCLLIISVFKTDRGSL